jgi:hypothetical protein
MFLIGTNTWKSQPFAPSILAANFAAWPAHRVEKSRWLKSWKANGFQDWSRGEKRASGRDFGTIPDRDPQREPKGRRRRCGGRDADGASALSRL